MNKVLIYLHAGNSHGMGHFQRSKLVGQFLKKNGYEVTFTGELSDYCVKQLALNFKLREPYVTDGDAVIVDALYVSQSFEQYLAAASNVIAISPMLNYNDCITHICTRSPIMHTNSISNKEVYVDPYFAFWGCLIENREFFSEKQKLDIGICISGSNQYFDVSNLVDQLIDSEFVNHIRLFTSLANNKYKMLSRVSVETEFRCDIWDFFSDVDVFLTGDGLMIYEAVARGFPTISFCRSEYSQKNRIFANQLFVEIPEGDWSTQRCVKNMFDTELWSRIKKNIQIAELSQNSDKLGMVILQILRKGLGNEHYYR